MFCSRQIRKAIACFVSYLLIGVLLAAARQGGHNETDRNAIVTDAKSALAAAFEAYACLYNDAAVFKQWETKRDADSKIGTVDAMMFQSPAICQFFDEKMARLDYALFRLALSSLFNEKSNSQLANIRDKLVGEIPVISASAKSAIFAARALNQTTAIVDDLLSLSFSSAGPVLTLLPLYRDALELNMWVIVDNLTRACEASYRDNIALDDTQLGFSIAASFKAPKTLAMDCATRDLAYHLLSLGNGDLRQWRQFVRDMATAGIGIDAYAPHFILVSQLIWRSCVNLIDSTKCTSLVSEAVASSTKGSIGVYVRQNQTIPYSASLRSPSQFAKDRLDPRNNPVPPVAVSRPSRDGEPTGSIPRSSGHAGNGPFAVNRSASRRKSNCLKATAKQPLLWLV